MKLSAAIALTEQVAWTGTSNGAKAARSARAALAHLGDRPLAEITTRHLDDWVAQMKAAGKSSATINRYLSYTSKVFTTAIQRDLLDRKPHFPFQREKAGRIRVLSKNEEARLLTHLPHIEAREIAVVLVDTGMRTGELFRLRGCDLNYGLHMIHVWQTKTGRPRSVPMTPRVEAILRRRADPKGALSPALLFPGGAWQFIHHWRGARLALGLTGDREFVPHMLRHTCATRLLQGGANIATVKNWLGHSTIRTTERYVHMSDRDLLSAAKFLEIK